MSAGGARAGSGRKGFTPENAHLKKEQYGTKLPVWLKLWLASKDRPLPASQMIEQALKAVYGAKPPDFHK